MHSSSRNISDFIGTIRDRTAPSRLLTTQASARRHAEDRAFIERELREAQAAALTPIVITHHAPGPRCVRPWCEGGTLNAAFASNLDRLIAQHQPPL